MNLDQYMHDKMDHREFQFREEHWLQAQVMIEKEERRRRRRRYFLWLLPLGLLGGMIACYYLTREPAKKQLAYQSVSIEDFSNEVLCKPIWSTDTASRLGFSFNEFISSASEKKRVSEIAGKQQKMLPGEEYRSNYEIQPETSAKPVKPINQKDQDQVITSNENLKVKKQETAQANTQTNQAKTTDLFNQKGDQTNQVPSASSQGPLSLAQNPETTSKGDELHQNDPATLHPKNTLLVLEVLPQLEPILSYQWNFQKPVFDSPRYDKKAQKNQSSGWMLGINTGASIIPDSKPVIGYFAGIAGVWQFNSHISLGLELNYLYVNESGNLPYTKATKNISYGFGRSEQQNRLQPMNMHYLSIPLSLRYRQGKHVAELGFQIDDMLGVRGKNETFLPSDSTIIGSGSVNWLVMDGFNAIHTSMTAGYQYYLSDQFAAGLRIGYQMQGKYKSGYTFPDAQSAKASSPWFIQLSARYYLLNRISKK